MYGDKSPSAENEGFRGEFEVLSGSNRFLKTHYHSAPIRLHGTIHIKHLEPHHIITRPGSTSFIPIATPLERSFRADGFVVRQGFDNSPRNIYHRRIHNQSSPVEVIKDL